MPHWRLSQIEKDLIEFVNLLKKYDLDLSLDLKPLNDLINQINSDKKEHSICDMYFSPDPKGLVKGDAIPRVYLMLDLHYKFIDIPSDDYDPFCKYQLNLHIKGYRKKTATPNSKEDKFFCWHLDREPKRNSLHFHPYYHLHAGGDDLMSKDITPIFNTSAPRIPHPPLDIFLAIHYIIENFFHVKKNSIERRILNDENYIMIIQRAQKRLLEPYYKVMSNTGMAHNDYSPSNLFPQYS